MLHQVLLVVLGVVASNSVLVAGKQQVKLSNSYLPVAMQIISHLTDQMAFEVKDDVQTPKPTRFTTAKPVYVTYYYRRLPSGCWWIYYNTMLREFTTPYHRPGLFAPPSPPKPSDRIQKNPNYVLLPVVHNSQYTFLEPQEKRTEEPLLAAHNEEVKPLVEPTPNVPQLLPPFDSDLKITRRSDTNEELDEENLQYLSPNVREMIRMANDPADDRPVDIWNGLRAHGNPMEFTPKGKLSSSNLRLLLLYDLLSRDAKRQRLSDYSGFSQEVMKDLVESSSGGARAQLSMALSKMVERHDCGHDYANNRAKEMVTELGKDESLLSSEIRYLQPLRYNY